MLKECVITLKLIAEKVQYFTKLLLSKIYLKLVLVLNLVKRHVKYFYFQIEMSNTYSTALEKCLGILLL